MSSLYHSPSQDSEEFQSFLRNFEHLLSDINALNIVVLGGFNATSIAWRSNDIDSVEGTKLFSLSTSNGSYQVISEPTHIQRNSSSCIDLIFTEQPSFISDKRVYGSLHSSCHHQIILCTFSIATCLSKFTLELQKG